MDQNLNNEFPQRNQRQLEEADQDSNQECLSAAMAALQKQKKQRGFKEIKAIMALLEISSFVQKLKKYNKNLPNQFANCLELECIKKGHTIFMQGDNPDKCYIIAKGKVSVLVQKSHNELSLLKGEILNDKEETNQTQLFFGEEGQPDKLNPIKMKKKYAEGKIKGNEEQHYGDKICAEINLTKHELDNWKQYYLIEHENAIFKYNHIKFINEGEVFGDFGLLVRKQRSASILAVEDCYLLSVQKQDYETLIREVQDVIILFQSLFNE